MCLEPAQQLAPWAEWQAAWRHGLSPQLTVRELSSLFVGLATDDERWVNNGLTTYPEPEECTPQAVQSACAVGYGIWQSRNGLPDVDGVLDRFEEVTRLCDESVPDLGMKSHSFLSWHDQQPRAVVRPALLGEVSRSLASRLIGYRP